MSVNAPESGVIKELLVSEEDTVTVGQEIIKLEPGEAPEGGKQEAASEQPKEAEKPKESAPAEKPKETQAEKPKEPQAEKPKPAPAPAQKPKEEPKESKPAVGGREERRVCFPACMIQLKQRLILI